MAIPDPSAMQPGAGISACMSEIVQCYVEEKWATAISAPIPAPIPAPTPGSSAVSVRCAQMITTLVKPKGQGASCSKAAKPAAALASPATPLIAPVSSCVQCPPTVSAAVCTAVAGMYATLEEQLHNLSAKHQHANAGEKKQLHTTWIALSTEFRQTI